MAHGNHGNEASVEEILESIKKVIARDNRNQALQARRQREDIGGRFDAEALDDGRDDAGTDRSVSSPADRHDAQTNLVEPHLGEPHLGETRGVLDLGDMLADNGDDEGSDNGRFDDARFDDEHDTDIEAPLIAEEVRGAMQENLAALAMLSQPGAKPQIVRSGETSLEGLTRELLRPMLAEWLDKNLPGMVEKMVQAEIARIAGKRR